jgi:biopolymer transport protein ExbD
MRFITHKRRQPPAVIVVALIDILVVLLIFLMVTTTMKQSPALKLALPESSQAQKTGAAENPPLVITIAANGSLFLGTERLAVTLDRLRSELATRAAGKTDFKIAISADKGAPFGQVVKVMDAAKEAGVKSVDAFMKSVAK